MNLILILILYMCNVSIIKGCCTERFMDLSLISYRAVQSTNSRDEHRLRDELRILEEYQFNCSTTTNITHLLLGLDVREATARRNLFPSVHIYRPTIGAPNQFNVVPSSERVIYYSTANVSTSGVFQYQLVPPIPVESGDLLAVSQPVDGDSAVRIHFIDETNIATRNCRFTLATVTSGTAINLVGSPVITNQLILIYPITDGYCVNSTITATVIRDNALLTHDVEIMNNERQSIYPEMIFRCNGSVTKWIYGGIISSSSSVLPELQIWRQTGGDSYLKVGASTVDTSTENGTNVYQYIPQSPLAFQEGDIFGVFIPDDPDFELLEQRRNGPLKLRIPRNIDTAPDTISESLDTDMNDFPLVTVEISTSIVSSTVIMISSTPLPIVTSSISSSSIMIPSSSETTTTVLSLIQDITSTSLLYEESSIMGEFTLITVNGSNDMTPSSDPLVDGSSALIAGLVIGVLVVLIAIVICQAVIIIALLHKRNKKKKTKGKKVEEIYELPTNKQQQTGGTLDNPLYSEGNEITDTITSQTMIDEHTFYAEAGMPTPPNYEEPSDRHYMEPTKPYTEYEWGIVVPTMSQRSRVESNDIYFELQNSIYSSLTKTDDTYKVVGITTDGSFFFTESDLYWAPGSDCSSIYEQLSIYKFREVIRGQIQINGLLGSGQFGTVHKGVWRSPSGPVKVAIKTLKDNTSEEEKVKFLQEAAIMGQFRHPNIIKLHGVVTLGDPVMIVIELMSNGDLKQYLETLKPSPGELVSSIVPTLLLSFCRQIASGMEYLSKKCFVHRDLAARNILVADQGICKISDFGLSRDLQDGNYYVSKGGQIPIKWTAPEALHYKKYSSASDVWSFGVVMYEIWSLGCKPFHNMTNQESFRKIDSGYRLSPPPGCPRAVYQMMIQCWHPESSERLSFADLVTRLSQPDWSLMLWSQNDKVTHPQCTVLGATLDAGKGMYIDLQSTYTE